MPDSVQQLLQTIDELMQVESDDNVRAKLARIRARLLIEFKN